MRLRRSALSDPESFNRFYSSSYEALLRYFARRVLDPQLALDLAAETFAQAFVERDKFRGGGDAEAAGWLYAIARSRLTTYYRRGSLERRALERLGIELPPAAPDELERIEELADLAGVREELQVGLELLNESQRLALQLRVVEERPYPEIARTLGVSEQTARARVSRALRALSQLVQPDSAIKETP